MFRYQDWEFVWLMWPNREIYGIWRRIDWLSVTDFSEKVVSVLQGRSKKGNLHGRNGCTVQAKSELASRHSETV